jgi:hypothetical protein
MVGPNLSTNCSKVAICKLLIATFVVTNSKQQRVQESGTKHPTIRKEDEKYGEEAKKRDQRTLARCVHSCNKDALLNSLKYYQSKYKLLFSQILQYSNY